MDTESLWLGPARQPMRLLMIGLAAAVGLVWLWLLIGVLFLGSDASMASLIRPEGNIVVKLLLWLIFGCAITTGLYLSDTRGMIEVEATGPMDILSLVLARITMVAIAVTVCVMFYEVVARYIFSSPTLWANELSLWIAGFTFLLAGLYAMQQRSHIRIYIIYDMMPWWAQKLSDCVTVLLIWIFFISLVWGGYNEVIAKIARMETFGTAWDPPLPSTVKAAILIVIGLVAVQALSNLIADWNKAPVEHTAADEIDEHEIELLKKTLGADDNG